MSELRSAITTALEGIGVREQAGRAWRALRHPVTTFRHERDIARDHDEFVRRFGAVITPGAERASKSRRVLIVSLGDWVAQAKAEGMLAKALQLRGLTPVVLTYSHARHARRYFEAFGFTEFEYLDQLEAGHDNAAADAETARYLKELTTLDQLMQLEYRGVFVGRHVLSSICRSTLSGIPRLDDPRVRALLQRLLRTAMRTVGIAEDLFDRLAPEQALFLERGYVPFGEFYDVAINRGVSPVQWFSSHIDQALVFRRNDASNRHEHPFSLDPRTWDDVRTWPWTAEMDAALTDEFAVRYREGSWFNRQRLQDGKRIKTMEETRTQLGLDPAKKTAVIFSHVLYDATFFYGEGLFPTYEEWLIETVRTACRNPQVNWIVKLHPANLWKLRGEAAGDFMEEIVLRKGVGELPPHVVLLRPETDINTYTFFTLMDYCVTVRGTVGMEAPCFGIPVLTAGTGRYAGRGFTIDSATPAEYLDRLMHIQDIPPMTPAETVLARRHSFALFKMRPLEFTSFRLLFPDRSAKNHPLDHNVDILVDSFQELAASPDLNTFADWLTMSTAPDLINAPTAAAPVASAAAPGGGSNGFHPHPVTWTPRTIGNLWDYYASQSSPANYFSYQFGAHIVRSVSEVIPLRGRRVLDFGAGPGFLLDHLLQYGASCLGLDFSEQSVEALRRRLSGTPGFEDAVAVSALPSPYADKSVDVIFLVEVLEHLLPEHIPATLGEIRRLLRPGGHLVVTVPHRELLSAAGAICPECGCTFHRWQHLRSFTPERLAGTVETHGFRRIRCRPTTFGASRLQPLRRIYHRLQRRDVIEPHLMYIGVKP